MGVGVGVGETGHCTPRMSHQHQARCCSFCCPSGSSTVAESCCRSRARCPPCLRGSGEGLGERCERRCVWQGLPVARGVGCQPQQGLPGGAGLGGRLGRSWAGWMFLGTAFLFQLSRQEAGQAEAASAGLSLPDSCCASYPLVRHHGTTVRLQSVSVGSCELSGASSDLAHTRAERDLLALVGLRSQAWRGCG